ncbi:MAG: LuxR family transcriptional regulator [bacterium]|nr:LuxR family transcriptional regulator [bacterium]
MTKVLCGYLLSIIEVLAFGVMTLDIEDFPENYLGRREKLFVALFLSFMGIVGSFGVYEDWIEGVSKSHLIIELSLNFLCLVAGFYLFKSMKKARQLEVASLSSSFQEAKRSAVDYRAQIESFKEGVTKAISQQLTAWKLTPAEEEISFLLLKGFSLQEIADLRQTSERTIRHQASILYKKCGVDGRAQLSAFFLEDLLIEPCAIEANEKKKFVN